MLKRLLILLFISITLIFSFANCASSKKSIWEEFVENVTNSFVNAVETFDKEDYQKSIEIFKNYTQLDSLFFNHEAYAFLAESYNRIGMKDSGLVIYQRAIERMKERIKIYPKKSHNVTLALNDILNWQNSYPKFPTYLLRENGFIPYDSIPEPIGGTAVIQKNLVYPNSARMNNLEGRFFILVLVNESGKPVDFDVIKPLSEDCSVAAINAIKKVSFKVPKKKERVTKMWVSIPIVFKLQ